MLKRIALAVIVLLVVVQAIRPHRNVSTQPPGRDDFIEKFDPPPEVRTVLEHACYDCHSNNTRYPWYANVQPVGWWLAQHVNSGKRHLNFSDFGTLSVARQGKKLDSMSDELTNRTMPLHSYLWIHKDARLSNQQVDAVSAWLDALHDKLQPME